MQHRILGIMALCLAVATFARADYYSDSQKGWWWGDRTVEEQKDKPEPKKQPEPREENKGSFVPPSLKTYTYEDVWNMHPDDFYELQESYKKKAVKSLAEDDVRDYYEMQEIARKKSQAFTDASQYVWQKHPELTVAKDYPVTIPGSLSRTKQANEEKRRVLRANRENYAIVYFWRPGCSYCEEQNKILKWFQDQTGWIVKAVNIQENPRAAAKVGVEITPTLVLIKKGEQDHFPVSAGVLSADEIEDKTYRAVRLLNGEITPQEYSLYEFQRGGGFDVNGRKEWVK